MIPFTDSRGSFNDGFVVDNDGVVRFHYQGKECLKSEYLKERIQDLTRELEHVQNRDKREAIVRKIIEEQMELDLILGLHDDEL